MSVGQRKSSEENRASSLETKLQFTLTIKGSRWLHKSHWEDRERIYWAEHRIKWGGNLFASAPFFKSTRKADRFVESSWLLMSDTNEIVALAEVQLFSETFLSGFFFHSAMEDKTFLRHLVSALFLSIEPDVLNIVCADHDAFRLYSELPYAQLLAPYDILLNDDPKAVPLRQHAFCKLEAVRWRDLGDSAEHKDSLKYLVKRSARLDTDEFERKPKIPRTGILGFFLRLRR